MRTKREYDPVPCLSNSARRPISPSSPAARIPRNMSPRRPGWGCRALPLPMTTRSPASSGPMPVRARWRGRCGCGARRWRRGDRPAAARAHPAAALGPGRGGAAADPGGADRADGRVRRHAAAGRPGRLGAAVPAADAGPAAGGEGRLPAGASDLMDWGEGSGCCCIPPRGRGARPAGRRQKTMTGGGRRARSRRVSRGAWRWSWRRATTARTPRGSTGWQRWRPIWACPRSPRPGR